MKILNTCKLHGRIIMIILESLFVGIYSLVIYRITRLTGIKNIVFVTGFFKHFLGYYSGLHGFYCTKFNLKAKKSQLYLLFMESILEGFLFMLFGKMFSSLNPDLSIFMTGFVLHTLSEVLGVHRYFINYHCE